MSFLPSFDVELPVPPIASLSRKKLLITGGTGSFGNAVLRKYLHTDIDEIRIFSRDEKKQDDMRHQYSDGRIKYYIGDVREPHSIASALRGVDYVFHAAALKQVPSCEFYPTGGRAHQCDGHPQPAERLPSRTGCRR